MKYNFDEFINRIGTDSEKWESGGHGGVYFDKNSLSWTTLNKFGAYFLYMTLRVVLYLFKTIFLKIGLKRISFKSKYTLLLSSS